MDKLIRIYRTHDLDLLALNAMPGFNIKQALKESLRAFVNNEDITIEVPEIRSYTFTCKDIAVMLRLNDKQDADIIGFIRSLRKGYGNAVVKHILRQSLASFNIAPFLQDSSEVYQSGGNVMITVYSKKQNVNKAVNKIEEQSENGTKIAEENERIEKEQALLSEPEKTEPDQMKSGNNEEAAPASGEEFDFFSALDKLM